MGARRTVDEVFGGPLISVGHEKIFFEQCRVESFLLSNLDGGGMKRIGGRGVLPGGEEM